MKVRFDKYNMDGEMIATRSVDGIVGLVDGETVGASAGIILHVFTAEHKRQVITMPLNGRVELYAV